jgi:hypothetical protein
MKHDPESQNRIRTLNDRRAFVASEEMRATAAQLMAEQAELQRLSEDGTLAGIQAPALSRTESAAKQRAILRKKQEAARIEAFNEAVAHVIYNAIPFDDVHKIHRQRTILGESREFLQNFDLKSNDTLNEAALDLADLTNGLVPETLEGFTESMEVVVANEMDDTDSDLYVYVTRLSETIQQRVVEAAANAHQRSAVLEARLSEVATIDDADVAEYAKQKALKSTGMTLIESLFVRNRKSLSEATESDNIPTDLVMAESVSQYAVLETVSALGIAPIDVVTRDMLVKSIVTGK